VVDDGSTDDTCGVVRVRAQGDGRIRLVENGQNRGKGYSVAHGVREAKGDWVLFSDADLSTPIEELLKLEAARGEAEIAIGSRALPDSDLKKRQPLYREMMGRTFNVLVQALVFPGIQDTQCGFKLFRADVAKKLFELRTIDGFAFDVEVLYLARKHGYAVAEVPVIWINDEASRVNPITHSLRMFSDILKVRGRHRG
jgi:dolichyl-phosphate beta-glucosyltransferase